MKTKTYANANVMMNIWELIDDLTAVGLKVVGVTNDTVTVAESAGYSIDMIDTIMSNRGFF